MIEFQNVTNHDSKNSVNLLNLRMCFNICKPVRSNFVGKSELLAFATATSLLMTPLAGHAVKNLREPFRELSALRFPPEPPPPPFFLEARKVFSSSLPPLCFCTSARRCPSSFYMLGSEAALFPIYMSKVALFPIYASKRGVSFIFIFILNAHPEQTSS